jgi:hypothetical protein
MLLTLLPGYPDLIGRRAAFVGYGIGPAVYNSTTGDVISIPGKYIDIVLEVPQDPTGAYYAVARPSFAGPRASWALHYYSTSSATELANNSTALAALNFVVSGFYGEY